MVSTITIQTGHMPPPDVHLDGWMIAQLKPHGLANARRNLERQGFAIFLPLLTVTRRQRNRLVTRPEPLFPGYLFVRDTGRSAPAGQISFTLGVLRLLTRGDRQPATLPAEFVAALAARCDPDGHLSAEPRLAVGDPVRVTRGPFADSVSRIAALDADGRVSMLIALLGRQVRVRLDPAQLDRG
jgi:transcriptional antiterminator RfaH